MAQITDVADTAADTDGTSDNHDDDNLVSELYDMCEVFAAEKHPQGRQALP
jgi:hypothetical protein